MEHTVSDSRDQNTPAVRAASPQRAIVLASLLLGILNATIIGKPMISGNAIVVTVIAYLSLSALIYGLKSLSKIENPATRLAVFAIGFAASLISYAVYLYVFRHKLLPNYLIGHPLSQLFLLFALLPLLAIVPGVSSALGTYWGLLRWVKHIAKDVWPPNQHRDLPYMLRVLRPLAALFEMPMIRQASIVSPLVLLAVAAVGVYNDDYRSLYTKCATEFPAEVRIDSCTQLIEQFAVSHDRHLEHLSTRARVYISRGDFPLAIQDLSQAIDIDPKHLGLRVQRGHILARFEKLDEAQADFDFVIENQAAYENVKPRLVADAYAERAVVQAKKGKLAEGLVDLQIAYIVRTQIEPTFAEETDIADLERALKAIAAPSSEG